VMYLASSEARNRIALLMSTGSTQGMSSTLSDLNALSAEGFEPGDDVEIAGIAFDLDPDV